jgi:hypothetical protein
MEHQGTLEAAVWHDLAQRDVAGDVARAGPEASTATLSEAIETVAPAYYDGRFRCFSKQVYKRLNAAGPTFSFRYETITRRDGVKIAGEIKEAMGPSDWRTLLHGSPGSGLFYRIQSGDTLLNVAKRAYASVRYYWGAQAINLHPFNRRLWRTDLAYPRLWPHGRISFSPRFSSDLDAQVTTRAGVGGAPRGSAFGVIFIPHTAWELKFDSADLTPGGVDILSFDVRSTLALERKLPSI